MDLEHARREVLDTLATYRKVSAPQVQVMTDRLAILEAREARIGRHP